MSTPAGGEMDLLDKARNEQDGNADLDADRTPATRGEAAVGMRIHGASFTEIATTLGFASANHARTVIERTLAAEAADPSDRASMRLLMDKRLNRLLRSVMPKAVNPSDPDHLAYVRAAVTIIERQGRLFGVDAPTEAIVYTPDSHRIEGYIAQITAMARSEQAEAEVDILDVDVIEER